MKNILIVVLLSWAGAAIGDPGPLVIDKSSKGRASDSKIESVHQEITTGTTDLRKIRLAIVNGMLETEGRAWTYASLLFSFCGSVEIISKAMKALGMIGFQSVVVAEAASSI